MIKIEISKADKKKSGFTKRFLKWYMISIQLIALATLYMCYLCITLNYTGGLAPLVALIGFAEVSFGIVAKAVTDKSKAENTSGGVVYESAMMDKRANTKIDVESLSI